MTYACRMIIHGYGQNGRSDFNKDLKNALLSHDDYNVIVGKFVNDVMAKILILRNLNLSVDWSSAAGSSYKTARSNVNAIGKSIAQFIDWAKLDKGYLHVIGFDLGGRVLINVCSVRQMNQFNLQHTLLGWLESKQQTDVSIRSPD